MSETFASKQEKADALNETHDFVSVDSRGHAHVPAGSGSKSGNFLSDHELKLIAAHADTIHEGYSARESENMLQNAVGVLEDPEEIRDSLEYHGYIDEDEAKDWNEQDIQSFVGDAREEVNDYAAKHSTGKRRAEGVAVVTEASGVQGRHAAVSSDESTFDRMKAEWAARGNQVPVFTSETSDNIDNAAVSAETPEPMEATSDLTFEPAQEGESLEEYEARNDGPSLSSDRLRAILDEAPEAAPALSSDRLRAILDDGEATAQVESQPRHRRTLRERMGRFGLTAFAANASAALGNLQHRREQRALEREESYDDERPVRRGTKILGGVAVAVALVGVGVIGYYKMMHGGGNHNPDAGTGDWLNHFSGKSHNGTHAGGSHGVETIVDTIKPHDGANEAGLSSFDGYKVKRGDSVWSLSEKLLHSQGVKHPTTEQIDATKDMLLPQLRKRGYADSRGWLMTGDVLRIK